MDTFTKELLRRIDALEKAVAKNETRESRGWEINYMFGGATGSYTFTLPQYGRHLKVRGVMRSDLAATASQAAIILNGDDASSNYHEQILDSKGGVTTSSDLGAGPVNYWAFNISGNNAIAKHFGCFEFTLYRYWYENTNISKVTMMGMSYIMKSAVADNQWLQFIAGTYLGNAPITTLTIRAKFGANIMDGSMITIYATN